MKTKQELFDNVWNYFIVEGHPQAKQGSKCLYRGPKSNCAVGCQLPDELYKKEMDDADAGGGSIGTVFEKFPKVAEYFGSANRNFLSKLQMLHDTQFDKLEANLIELASRHQLTIPNESQT